MSRILEEYEKLVQRISTHWDSKNEVLPNYFSYERLKHIVDTIDEKRGNSNSYRVTDLVLTNNENTVEYSVIIDEKLYQCPSYIMF